MSSMVTVSVVLLCLHEGRGVVMLAWTRSCLWHCWSPLRVPCAFLQGGWNPAAIGALILGVLPSLPGFLHSVGVLQEISPLCASIYDVSWFVGVGVSSAVYVCLMKMMGRWGEAEQGGKGMVLGLAS